MKPPLLRAVVVLLCIFNLAGFAFIDPTHGRIGMQIAFASAIVLMSFLVIWRFWIGSRLSRVLVLITSGIAIMNLLSLSLVGTIQKTVIIGEALFAVFLFYWLFTRTVRKYFDAGPKI